MTEPLTNDQLAEVIAEEQSAVARYAPGSTGHSYHEARLRALLELQLLRQGVRT